MFDFGIESATKFDEIAFYSHLWIVEFRDWTRIIVIENTDHESDGELEGNFIIEAC